MRNGLDVFFKLCDILHALVVHDNHREGTHAVFIDDDVLPFHRIQRLRKVCQQIVVCLGVEISICCRKQQDNRQQKDQHSVFSDPLAYFYHFSLNSLPIASVSCIQYKTSLSCWIQYKTFFLT